MPSKDLGRARQARRALHVPVTSLQVTIFNGALLDNYSAELVVFRGLDGVQLRRRNSRRVLSADEAIDWACTQVRDQAAEQVGGWLQVALW
jgi:hypothetical protein